MRNWTNIEIINVGVVVWVWNVHNDGDGTNMCPVIVQLTISIPTILHLQVVTDHLWTCAEWDDIDS